MIGSPPRTSWARLFWQVVAMAAEEAGGAGLPLPTAAAVPPEESEVSPGSGVTEAQAGPDYAGADRHCVMP